MKLAEQGKLAISDPLAKYFPDVPNAKTITLRHLLTHTFRIAQLHGPAGLFSRGSRSRSRRRT